MPIIELEDLYKSYRTGDEELVVFDGFSFKAEAGESVAVTGESGSGKSTLLNLIAGLDSFQKGRLAVCSQPIKDLNEQELSRYRNRNLGFIFQFHFLLKDFNALENVAMPALIGGQSLKTAKRRALELLEAVQLADKQKRFLGQLSGGERQRVAIARALMNDPQLILADEPTGSLDEKNADKAAELLLDLTAKGRKTLLLVTHDRQLAKKCRRSISLAKGKVL